MTTIYVGEPRLAAALGTSSIPVDYDRFIVARDHWVANDDNSYANDMGIHFYLIPIGDALRPCAAPKDWPAPVVIKFYQMGELPHGSEATASSGTIRERKTRLDRETEESIRVYLNAKKRR